MAWAIAPPWPAWTVAAAGLAACVWAAALYLTVRYAVDARARTVLLALRLLALAVITACLLNPLVAVSAPRSRGEVRVLVDASTSMGIGDALGGRTRWQSAVELARDLREAVASQGRFEPRLYPFGMALGAAAKTLPEKPDQPRTNIPAALLDALSLPSPSSPAALFVVTDGASNVPQSTEALAERLRRAAVPVYVALVGASEPSPDVVIEHVSNVRKVALKTHVTVTVDLRARNLPKPAATEARLLCDGAVVGRRPLELGDGTTRVEFEFVPDKRGMLPCRVEVDPVEGELTSANNVETFSIDCDRRQLKVLYMEGSQYRRENQTLWEYQFLVQALEEDPDIRVTPLFKDDVGAARKAGVYWIRHPEHGFPRTRKDLYQYDVIISSDIDIEYFTPQQLRDTVDFVGRRGGGFIMIGGYTAFGAGGYDESIIDRILPVDMKGRADGYFEDYETQFPIRLTPEGLRHPVCRIDPDPVKNLQIWSGMPKLGGFNYVERAKDLATVLGVHPSRMNEHGNYVLLAVQQYGRGRTMAFTSDTTAGWGEKFETEWGDKGDNRYYRKFWQNAVRWLAAYRIDEAPRPLLLRVDTNQYTPGDTVRIEARVFDEDYDPTDEAQVTAAVRGPDGALSSVVFSPVAGSKGRYETSLTADRAGPYMVRAEARLGERLLGDDSLSFLCGDSFLELKDYDADRGLLDRLAEASGGRVFGPGETAQALEAARALRAGPPARAGALRSAWDHWLVLGCLCACLCSEWWLRRRHGLP